MEKGLLRNMNKERKILDYIKKCDDMQSSNNQQEVKRLKKEIIGVYCSEIPNITSKLNAYGITPRNLSLNEDKEDLLLLKAKLENYKYNLEMELEKYHNEKNNGTNININNSSTANNTVNVNITLEQIMKSILELPEQILSNEDKEEFEDKINALKEAVNSKDKEKISQKINRLIHFALEKGPAIVTLASSAITLFSDKILPLFGI